ncbi:MAG: hypothetical protein EXR07_11065 [Acetobacteraceae bacterium]|nr:hypothetical protein [Acetobacteraceae bacterium]
MDIRHAEIERLVPQKGAMCLLDSVLEYSADGIACGAVSHLDPANPLIWNGRLGICAVASMGCRPPLCMARSTLRA